MSSPRRRHPPSALGGVLAAVLAALAGCESPTVQGPPPPEPSARRNRRAAADAPDAGAPRLAAPVLSDTDFNENERTRDPFRNFAREFVPVGPQQQVAENAIILRQYSLDELRLVAIVMGTGSPYAMVVDPTGTGTILRRGNYVGRPETVPSGPEGSMPHQVPWRVARIIPSRVRRDGNSLHEIPGEVVFEREDRLNPGAPRVERSLLLNPGSASDRQSEAQAVAPPPNLLPLLPPGAGAAGVPQGAQPGAGGATYTQSYTTVVPPQPAPPPPPTTVLIQTGPHGQTTVTPAPQGGAPAAPQGPRDPYGPPPGGSTQPPPVQVYSGSSLANEPMPSSGLSR